MATTERSADWEWDPVSLPRFDTRLPPADVPRDDWKVCWDRRSLLHALGDHVLRANEPWGEVLGTAFVDAIREMLFAGRLNQSTTSHVSSGLDYVWDEVRRCSARPRLIQMYVRLAKRSGSGWLKRWLLLLPAGWILILERQSAGVAGVASLYFHRAACLEEIPHSRWRRVLRDHQETLP